MSEKPVRLEPSLHQKIWGVSSLEPWFHSVGGRIGEVWFEGPGPDPLPILAKFIFTSERLSVQVHPDDAYARAHEASPGGKAEMMYILRAEPGATIAAGFLEPITLARAREAAISGEIEQLLRWWPAIPGQVYFIPAGTVHALGAGITVCEISQNNPITYRLFDYGRPRELHLERGLDVSVLEPHPGPAAPQGNLLASCSHFVAERLVQTEPLYRPDPTRFHLLIALEGGGRLGRERFEAGDVWCVPAAADPFPLVMRPGSLLLRTYLPAH
jgi:mannose-6-phosphate isomerase